jgi:hypothetical protein
VDIVLIVSPLKRQPTDPRGTGIVHAPPSVHELFLIGIHIGYIVAVKDRADSPYLGFSGKAGLSVATSLGMTGVGVLLSTALYGYAVSS